MYLQALSTAVPSKVFTASDCWKIVRDSPVRDRLNKRSQLFLQAILRTDYGVASRHLAVGEAAGIFDLSSDQLNENFRRESPKLAAEALAAALVQCGRQGHELDALLVCTCTGYLCPGLSSYVSELLGIKPDAYLQDLVGLGCGAAIPTLRSASHFLAANPGKIVACIAVEVCSAAFYLDDDAGVLVSACLFGDGAAASIWSTSPGPSGLRCFDFNTLHVPAEREKLRFEQRNGKLRNLLDRSVPSLAAAAIARIWSQRGSRKISQVVTHAGGRDVLDALEPVLSPYSLATSRKVLRQYGNMSSPSVLFTLEEALKTPAEETGDYWLTSFGAGFSAHSCRIGRDD